MVGVISFLRGGRRRRTPTVLQMEAVECGAACLSMILSRHGRHVPLEHLRYECGVSRDGTKASNILKAAKRFGMMAKGFSVPDPLTLRDMSLPMIVYWTFDHFVVLEGFGPGKVYLNDPATGPRTVTNEEFDKAFTGVALTLEPGPAFSKGGRRPSVTKGLWRRLGNSRAAFFFIALASLALTIPGILAPSLSRAFVDYYLVGGFTTWLTPLLAAIIGVGFLRALLTGLQLHFLLRLQTKLAVTGTSRFLWHVLRLPIDFFIQRYGGDIAKRVELNDRVAQLIAGNLATTLFSVLTMVLYAVAMAQYSLRLTALAGLFAVLNLVVFALVARNLTDASQRLLVDQSTLNGLTMQSLQMIESYKASGTENAFFARWAGQHAKVINSEQALARRRMVLGITPVLLSMIGSTTILIAGGFAVMTGTLTIGTLVGFQALMASFLAPVIGLVHLGDQMLEAQGEIIRLDDVMIHDIDPAFAKDPGPPPTPHRKTGPPPVPPTPPPPLTALSPGQSATAIAATAPATDQIRAMKTAKLTGQVDLVDVAYGFSPTDPPLIQGLSVTMRPGTRIALVGGSGSGKSTSGKLIAGLYTAWSGQVLFDGRPVETIPRALLRNSVALVDQDITLFEGSVSENISLWDPTMPPERIVRAARDAGIHDDISQRAGAYDSAVKEGGRNFSGGQRQRIEIARALAINPSILILDEATSALDANVEKQVIENVRRRGCTCVIIAHRLSTIRDCDEILLLQKGRVVERGTHSQLMAAGGGYHDLLET